ncbi:MAG: hypothetical protein IT453_10040 [Planctomycetes bacterium]|nr:hypothetical protein [Planctomycetota bacterium]
MDAKEFKRFGLPALAAWVAAFVLARGWLVLSLSDVFFYGEEFAKGTAAKALLDGLPLEHWQLAYHPYEGGGFVTSHLDALAFALIGPSLLAQKLVALAFGVAILCVGARFVARWFGFGPANAFCALYVLAPASVQKLSLLNLGIHYQALLFSLLVLHLALRVGFEEDARPRTWLAYGVAVGFGFFFSYQCALTIAVASLWLAWQARARLARGLGWTLGGALVGVAPLLYMAWHTGRAVFDIHGAEVTGAEDDLSKLEVVVSFWSSLVEGRSAWDLAGVFALPIAALVGASAWFRRRGEGATATRLVVIGLALFLATYFASTFAVGEIYHYFKLNRLSPAWLACVLLAAAGFAEHAAGGVRRAVLALLLLVALASGAGDVAREARAGAGGPLGVRVELLTRFKGYDYRYWLGQVLPRIEGTREERARIALSFREDGRRWLAASVGEQVWLEHEGAMDDAVAEAMSVDPSGELLLGFGPVMKRKLGGSLRFRVELLQRRPEVDKALLEEAAGRFGTRFLCTEDLVRAELEELRGVAVTDAFWRGFGWRLFEALGDVESGRFAYWEPMRPPLWARRSRAVEFLAGDDPAIAKAILVGYDEARAAHCIP